jgi:hypothetical protein
VAEGEIEVPKAAITLDPPVSRRGTTVTASGTGFPAGSLVQVEYGDASDAIAAGTADSSGAVSIDFSVPRASAGIGMKHEVTAKSIVRTIGSLVIKSVSAKATHETPGAAITLSTTSAQRGGSLTVTGVNFPAFSPVNGLDIGTTSVLPSPSPTTSVDGDFEITVGVPGIATGNYTLKVTVSGEVITEQLTIVEAPVVVSTDPAEVFAELGDRLARVWHFNSAQQGEGQNPWTFYDTDLAFVGFNTLTEVSSGDIVTLIISSGDTVSFQGEILSPGTNYISLD